MYKYYGNYKIPNLCDTGNKFKNLLSKLNLIKGPFELLEGRGIMSERYYFVDPEKKKSV